MHAYPGWEWMCSTQESRQACAQDPLNQNSPADAGARSPRPTPPTSRTCVPIQRNADCHYPVPRRSKQNVQRAAYGIRCSQDGIDSRQGGV
eukprot:1162039-Pelagomonas_calceolata.AAC.4